MNSERTKLAVVLLILLSGCSSPANKPNKIINQPVETSETVREKKQLTDKVVLISHRGFPKEFPEHSFSGYDRGIELGSQYIEQDIYESEDGVLFVSHDDNLKRTTGTDLQITKNMSETIDKVTDKNGEKVHRLAEVFNRYGKNVHYVIETKGVPNKNFSTEKELVALSTEFGVTNQIIFQSFSLESLKAIKEAIPDAVCMFLIGSHNKDAEKQYKQKGFPPIICFDYKMMTDEIVEACHTNGKKLYVYTVDDPDIMNQLLEQGVDGFFTNDTQRGMEVIDAYEYKKEEHN